MFLFKQRWSIMLEIKDLCHENVVQYYEKHILNEYFFKYLNKKSVRELIDLCKFIMERKEPCFSLIEKYAFDAIKSKVDSITKVSSTIWLKKNYLIKKKYTNNHKLVIFNSYTGDH